MKSAFLRRLPQPRLRYRQEGNSKVAEKAWAAAANAYREASNLLQSARAQANSDISLELESSWQEARRKIACNRAVLAVLLRASAGK